MHFVKKDQETLEKESDLPISSLEPTSFMSKVLTEEWKIFSFVVSVGIIIGLFSRLLSIKLWIHFLQFLENLLRIQLQNSVLQNHFIGNKASKINKNLFWYFYWNCLFCFICFLKILTGKITVSTETIGFNVWMAKKLSLSNHVP